MVGMVGEEACIVLSVCKRYFFPGRIQSSPMHEKILQGVSQRLIIKRFFSVSSMYVYFTGDVVLVGVNFGHGTPKCYRMSKALE